MPALIALILDLTPQTPSERRRELAAAGGNLADLKLLPAHRPIEPIGFLIFVCCLGYVTAPRTLAREEFGKSRLKEFLAASTSSASHFADALLLELRRWSGADAERTRDDDITLLILDFQTTP
jgi:serine phosphatase RsbU (regulator of sigma subunit)